MRGVVYSQFSQQLLGGGGREGGGGSFYIYIRAVCYQGFEIVPLYLKVQRKRGCWGFNVLDLDWLKSYLGKDWGVVSRENGRRLVFFRIIVVAVLLLVLLKICRRQNSGGNFYSQRTLQSQQLFRTHSLCKFLSVSRLSVSNAWVVNGECNSIIQQSPDVQSVVLVLVYTIRCQIIRALQFVMSFER